MTNSFFAQKFRCDLRKQKQKHIDVSCCSFYVCQQFSSSKAATYNQSFFIYCVFNRNFRGIIKNHISYICNLCRSLKCGRNLGGHSNLSQINTESIAQCKTKIHSPHSPHYFPTVTKEETFTEMRLVPMDTRLSKTSCNSITVLRDTQQQIQNKQSQ